MTIDSAFTHVPSLTTNRLHLRQLRSNDVESYGIRSDKEWDFVIVGTFGTRLFGLQHGKGMLVAVSCCCVVTC